MYMVGNWQEMYNLFATINFKLQQHTLSVEDTPGLTVLHHKEQLRRAIMNPGSRFDWLTDNEVVQYITPATRQTRCDFH